MSAQRRTPHPEQLTLFDDSELPVDLLGALAPDGGQAVRQAPVRRAPKRRRRRAPQRFVDVPLFDLDDLALSNPPGAVSLR